MALVAVACGPGVDTTPPLLALLGLKSGDVVVSDRITVNVRVLDDRQVATVAFRTDQGAEGPCRGIQDAGYACGAIPLAAGPNIATVRAEDAAGNVAELTFVVVRDAPDATPPTLDLYGIEDGATVTRTEITLYATVLDERGVASVTFATDGGSAGTCGPPDGDTWPCGPIPLPLGDTTITVVAEDTAGNTARQSLTLRRQAVEPSPDVTPPSLRLLDVVDGQTVTSSGVTATVEASDDRGVASVAFATSHGATGACDSVVPETYRCGPIPLPEGDTTITFTATDAAGNSGSASVTVRRSAAPPPSGFDIEIVFFDEAFSASQRSAFFAAVDRWEALVVGDLEDVTVDFAANGSCGLDEPAYAGTIDDLVIFATSFSDGVGGLLGSAGPCLYRASGTDAATNLVGLMRFDTMDLAQLEASGSLVDTIVHEMAHVLGFGTSWELPPYFDLLDYLPSDLASSCRNASGFLRDPAYVGTSGIAAYHDLGGSGSVPVEESGGRGTQCGHWDEEAFGDELMTGYLNLGGTNPLSALSVLSLQDIGLTVDASQADPYVLPSFPALRTAGGFDLAAAEELLRARGGVDPATGRIQPRNHGMP